MFVAVMDHGSFAAAARARGTSSGQASKLVAALEERLGTRLLNRTTRALALTELGQAYLARIRVLLEELDALDDSLTEAGGAPRGKLRLSAPQDFGALRLADLLNAFAARFPAIELEVIFTDRLVQLVEEGFDAAIRIGAPEDSGLIARKLGEMRVTLLAAPAYLAAHGTPRTPGELAGHACIIDSNFREPRVWPFRGTSVAISGRLRYSTAHACLNAAEHGLGIAYVPDFVAETSLAEGRVVPLLEDWQLPPHAIRALFPSGRHMSRKLRVLLDYLAEAFG